MRKTLMSVAALALLAGAGCAANGGGMPSPQLTFSQFAPVTLNAQSSTVTEAYTVPNDPQDMSGQFVIAPAEAIKRYAAQRFPATGSGDGQFNIAIEDARVHMQVLKENNKVLAWSGAGQEDEYRLFLKLKVTPKPSGVLRGPSTMIRMERTLVMPSSITLAEREMRQVKFLEKLIADVDKGIMKLLDETPGMRQ